MTIDDQRAAPRVEELLWARDAAEAVLRRAGFMADEIDTVLTGIDFPAPLSRIAKQGERFGITTGSLMERMGASP